MFRRYILAMILFCFIWSVPAYAEEDKALAGASTIGEVFGYISRYHLKQTDIDQLTKAGIKGMLEQLEDPYTVYFPPGELEHFSDELNGDFEGIGAELEIKDQYPCIVRVLTGTPAEAAGLQKGDVILAVDGQDVAGKEIYDIVSMLRGEKGTHVNLTVKRDGQSEITVSITRNTVNLPTVRSEMLSHGIGYLAIESFGMETGAEFAEALIKLQQSGSRSLIIDLRNNGGGYVDAAAEIASYLLGKDKTVFVTVDRAKHRDAFITELDSLIEEMPLVVLVNEQTASAAEILAGALQDYQTAVLVGTPTYGKGTVQDIIPLSNGGALKLTTAYYTTPRGRYIDGSGLQPDHCVTIPELQLSIAKQLLHPTKQVIQFTAGQAKAVVNDEIIPVPGGLLKEQGSAMVPLRFTLEALGYQVAYDGRSQTVKVTGKQQVWLLPTKKTNSLLNGLTKQLHLPLREKNNTVYISAKDLMYLGLQVTVQENKVTVSSK
ncbi:S41 family peptidase [Desulforamulus hydrothermalis]|uniref:Carboxyl-terminal protease n=1 Tax=Desulforamulus hydrothermalis Lam5 = DSM 18033 TaxID=1121428 RepID=K8DXJ9_9FIRM|nr:S41 family peptidase [Desulforamulus hydrothermalis]CCO07280.1 Carboxyl-terminal protease [Desulforamulus hydrothermalis Lam5 = DSM 18033]